jgi:hypothetical protein
MESYYKRKRGVTDGPSSTHVPAANASEPEAPELEYVLPLALLGVEQTRQNEGPQRNEHVVF